MLEQFELNIYDIQPSQLFVSNEKLTSIYKWLNAENNYNYDPIPVKHLNDKIIFTDGHTRAFALYKLGFEKIKVYWDTDELDWEAYQICVNWCVEESITNITQLEYRILDSKQYEQLWHNKCRKMQAELMQRRLRET